MKRSERAPLVVASIAVVAVLISVIAAVLVACQRPAAAGQPVGHQLVSPPPRGQHGMPVAMRRSGAVPGSLVYVCSAWPCTFDQVLATYDQYGNPLVSIGPYANVTSYGLALTITPLGNVLDQRMTVGWEAPIPYDKALGFSQACNPGDLWLAPDGSSAIGEWYCPNGTWVLRKDL